MKVEIEELKGKYYGTDLIIDDGKREIHLTIWAEDTENIPSVREMENWESLE